MADADDQDAGDARETEDDEDREDGESEDEEEDEEDDEDREAPRRTAGPEKREGIRVAGVVELRGRRQVLLEDRATGERRFFTEGEVAFGCRVLGIDERGAVLTRGDEMQTVRMSTAPDPVEPRKPQKRPAFFVAASEE